MGAFDDLIPTAGPSTEGGGPLRITVRPEDAYPKTSSTQGGGGTFDDLIPKESTQGEAFGRGVLNSATFNFRDELHGLARAGGLDPNDPDIAHAIGALVTGAYRKTVGDPEAEKLYQEQRDLERQSTTKMRTEHPRASLAGEVVGGLAIPVGAMAQGATLPIRMGRGVVAGAGIGALSGAGEGEGLGGTATGAAAGGVVGGAIGGVAPPIVEGAIQGVRAVSAPVVNRIRGAFMPEAEAGRRVSTAIERDTNIDPNAISRLTPQEFARSGPAGPARLMDLGGETTRALARSSANTSPEGRVLLNEAVNNRFEGQADRITNWLNRSFHFPNAHAQQQALDQTSRTTNRTAYVRAYREGAGGVGSQELERLAGSDAVGAAMQAAAKSSRDEAIAGGYGAMNPRVTFTPDGRVIFNRGPTGVPIYPDLQFWDLTRRELSDAAQRAGRGTNENRRLSELARQLNAALDAEVPVYQAARQGAAHFFGAENALEAGQNFVSQGQRFGNREARVAIARMSPTERQLFQDGYVSRLVEKLNATGDRRNVLNQIAQSPAAREELTIALGRQRATELEAGLRIEGIMDLARSAVQGNSTTARQLVELGLAGSAGGLGISSFQNADPYQAGLAILTAGIAGGRHAIDQRVARRVAEMLTSRDPQVLQRGIASIARSDHIMNALRGLDLRLTNIGMQQSSRAFGRMTGAGISRADENQQGIPGPAGQ